MELNLSLVEQGCHPLTEKEQKWLKKMLDMDFRTSSQWNKIMETMINRTVYSVVLTGKGMKKYSKEGLLFDKKSNVFHVCKTIEALPALLKGLKLDDVGAEEYMVVGKLCDEVFALADVRGLNVSIDQYTGDAKFFMVYTVNNGNLNAALAVDIHSQEQMDELLRRMKKGYPHKIFGFE